jgi:hypothetical protein
MPEPYAETLATVAAGRTALVARLRTIAARVEELPLEAAAEVLVLLEPAVATFERDAALALERAPDGAGGSIAVRRYGRGLCRRFPGAAGGWLTLAAATLPALPPLTAAVPQRETSPGSSEAMCS